MIDRDAFFGAIRGALFDGSLSQSQIDGIGAILDAWEARADLTDLRWLAYMLATAHHETARAMQPVIETRQPRESTNPSVDVAIGRLERAWTAGKMPWVKRPYWRKDADGISWLGRGLPQVTHRENYATAERKTGIPFTRRPDLMLTSAPAVATMISGMTEGWFTGKRLRDFFRGTRCDWGGARKIINGTESAAKVAGYARNYYSVLTLTTEEGEHVPAPPKPIAESKIVHGTAISTTIAAGKEGLEAVQGAADQVRQVKDAAEDVGLWDFVVTLAHQPGFWIALGVAAIGGLIIYWRWRDHA